MTKKVRTPRPKRFTARLFQLRPDLTISFDLILNGTFNDSKAVTPQSVARMFAGEVVTYAKKRAHDLATKGYTNLNGIKVSHDLMFQFEGANINFDSTDTSIKMRLRATRKGEVVKATELANDIAFVIENSLKDYTL